MGKKSLIYSSSVFVLVGVPLILVGISARSGSTEVQLKEAKGRIESSIDPLSPAASSSEQTASRLDLKEAEDEAVPTPAVTASRKLGIPEMEHASLQIQTSIQDSLKGRFDLDGMLEAALTLGNLPVIPQVLQVPNPTSTLRFALDGAPEGIQAEFWILPHGYDGSRAYSLRFDSEPPCDPWIVDGAARFGSSMEVTIVKTPDGTLQRVLILSSMTINPPGSLEAGIDTNFGVIPGGAQYAFDVANPKKWTCKTYGWIGGVEDASQWNGSTAVSGSGEIKPETLAQLDQTVSAILDSIQQPMKKGN